MLWVWLSLCSEGCSYAPKQIILWPKTDIPRSQSIAGSGTVSHDYYGSAVKC